MAGQQGAAGGPAAGRQPGNAEYAVDLLRAFGGAVLFAVPLLMTMEMWELGSVMDRSRLALFLTLNAGMLLGLSYFAGFRPTFSLRDDALDAAAAYGVGVVAATILLALFNAISLAMPAGEVIGRIAVQAVPASIGAMAARRQLGAGDDEDDDAQGAGGYGGQLFLMAAGALFFAFNVAPTEEMVLIAFMLTPWHGLALVLVSLAALHALVYALGFAGQEDRPEGAGFWRTFAAFSVAGYGIAVLVSLYALWTFGRLDGSDTAHVAMMTAVLAFPAALGAAVARLVV